MDGATVAAEGVIEREIRIEARPETVFAFWTDPCEDGPLDGSRHPARSSTGWRDADRLQRFGHRTWRVRRGRPTPRIVLTWGWEAPGDETPPGASTVEVDFVPDGDGTIAARHSGWAWCRGGHAEGWDQFLPALVVAVGASPQIVCEEEPLADGSLDARPAAQLVGEGPDDLVGAARSRARGGTGSASRSAMRRRRAGPAATSSDRERPQVECLDLAALLALLGSRSRARRRRPPRRRRRRSCPSARTLHLRSRRRRSAH